MVTHFMFILITKVNLRERGVLSHLQVIALVVSALCHDLDHRGTICSFQVRY